VSTYVANQVTYPVAYDLRTDLQPIALAAFLPALVVTRGGMPGGNLKELTDWLLTTGTGGVGGSEHLAGLLFQQITQTRFQFIPYRGSAPAVQDLSGQIDMIFGFPPVTLPHIQAGRLKGYAVMARSHLEAVPSIPTVDEAGAVGAYLSSWLSLWAPARTPPAIIAKLNAAITSSLADAGVRARLTDLGLEIYPPEQQTTEGGQSSEQLASRESELHNRFRP
jgi:tripartite-type tricarboxylate transporter receptor subunit TctC